MSTFHTLHIAGIKLVYLDKHKIAVHTTFLLFIYSKVRYHIVSFSHYHFILISRILLLVAKDRATLIISNSESIFIIIFQKSIHYLHVVIAV